MENNAKSIIVFLLVGIFVLVISSCFNSTRSDLQKIVDEKLEEPLLILWSYFEQEDNYTFEQAKEAYNTVNDVIYDDFY